MKTKSPFNSKQVLEDAAAGNMDIKEIKKAIKRADELGLKEVHEKLKLFVVSPTSFANDNVPKEISERIAQGISVLVGMGYNPQRTRNMLKRNGVVETLNRIAKNKKASDNFGRMVSAGRLDLTAEAIVVDFPEYFSEEALAVAKDRLSNTQST